MAAKRKTGTQKRDQHLVRGLSHKMYQAMQALTVLSDDELEGMARHLKQCDGRNTWYVTYECRDEMLRMIRSEQAERRTRKAVVLDDFDMGPRL